MTQPTEIIEWSNPPRRVYGKVREEYGRFRFYPHTGEDDIEEWRDKEWHFIKEEIIVPDDSIIYVTNCGQDYFYTDFYARLRLAVMIRQEKKHGIYTKWENERAVKWAYDVFKNDEMTGMWLL